MKMGRTWVWAPRANEVDLVLFPEETRIPMVAGSRGVFEVESSSVAPGQRYAFSLDGGPPRPDPRSAWQPEGIHGPSCWYDFDAFPWTDEGFHPVPLASAVMYELHVGTFSPQGTFDGAIPLLPHLRALGVTHVEIMPVAHFSGERGWGYDGVCLFAPHTAYGGPQGLQRFVDACHGLGMAVILDVVYNHLGPVGNYLAEFGPYFTSIYRTPWGDALNYDDAGSDFSRSFVCDNACFWLEHYHIDGLRLDAIHAILDQSATHVLAQMAQEVDRLSTRLGRRLLLIAESGLNDPRVVLPPEVNGYGLDGQWSDDLHHALHAALTGERAGYYVDFGSIACLADTLTHGFAYRGQYSAFRERRFGADTRGLRGRNLVVFAQNHDQVGNRAIGDRPSVTLSSGELKIAAAVILLSPFVPMLFMGEEWGTQKPFQYFTDHADPELARAVREGRKQEFAVFGWDPDRIPDPQASSTFEAARLDWDELEQAPHRDMLAWYRDLLALRRSSPSLADDRLTSTNVTFNEGEGWLCMQRGTIFLVCNFSDETRSLPLPSGVLEPRLASTEGVSLDEGRVRLAPRSVAILERTDASATNPA